MPPSTRMPVRSVTRLSVQDDGAGFDPAQLDAKGQPPGSGLQIMHERAIALGGQFRLQSAPGAGTCIECTVPATRQ